MRFFPALPNRREGACGMRAEMTDESGFARGLLDPAAAVPPGVSAGSPRRYAVYRNNVTVGLVRALEANFPAVRRLLGEAYFAGLARAFTRAHPPRSPLLFQYGEGLAGYPYLADVARLERLWLGAWHAADQPVLTAADLAHLNGEYLPGLRLAPHPALGLLASPHAVHAIFTVNRDGGSGIVTEPFRRQCVLVTRPGLTVETRLITPAQHGFLSALAGGATLADAATEGLASDKVFDVAAAIALLLEAGAFQHQLPGNES
jgi:Putative DNA-binding domain